jgi:hypothetical protein
MPPIRLDEVLRKIARSAVCLAIGLSMACCDLQRPSAAPRGSSRELVRAVQTQPVPEVSRWENLVCDCVAGWCFTHDLFARVKLPRVDYAGLYSSAFGDRFPTERTGIECATATDAAACKSKVEMAISAGLCSDIRSCGEPLVISTTGDEVKVWHGRAGMIALLGSIDSAEKAALVVLADRQPLQFAIICARPSSTPMLDCDPCRVTKTRANGDGYDLRMEINVDCGERSRQTIHVAADGTVSEVAMEQFPGPPCAPPPPGVP